MEAASAYAILGARPGSPPAALRAAYRESLARYHPDSAGSGDARALRAVQIAYRSLRTRPIPRVGTARLAARETAPAHVDVYA